MAKELEIEFKNLLTEEEFSALQHHFKIASSSFQSQDNHYFDTSDFALKENGVALRIRHKNNQYTLTLKAPVEKGILETNQPITEIEAQRFLHSSEFPVGEVFDEFTAMNLPTKSLQHFGTLSTDRAETEFENGLLVFDRSSYLNKVDFELEYEVSDYEKGKELFHSLLTEMEIPLRKTENKIKRFYNERVKGSQI